MDIFAGIFELIGNYLIGNKNRFGFLINIVSCCIWIYVAIIFHIYGLLIVVVPAIIINIRNFIKWYI
jgi:hypothetical protein